MTFQPLAVSALFTALCFAVPLEVDLVATALVKDRLQRGAVGASQRQAKIRDLFQEAGCSVEEQQIDKHSGNVICTLLGQTDSTIVVGAHFDFGERGTGMVDNWSGTSLLPSLYQALKGRPRQHTYVFVAFAAQKRQFLGSSRYVNNLTSEQKARVRAYVNLDCIGLTSARVRIQRSTPALVNYLIKVADTLRIPLEGVNFGQVAEDDTHSFIGAHIPVVAIHSVTPDTVPILRTERDRLDAIHFDDYYTTYKLLAYYLAYLDVKTDP